MSEDKLKWIMSRVATMVPPDISRISPNVVHHFLRDSRLRDEGAGGLGCGDFFVTIREEVPAGAGYLFFDMMGKLDLHMFTHDSFRRSGVASELFKSGILPWARRNGLEDEIITTNASAEGAELLASLGFSEISGQFYFDISQNRETSS